MDSDSQCYICNTYKYLTIFQTLSIIMHLAKVNSYQNVEELSTFMISIKFLKNDYINGLEV